MTRADGPRMTDHKQRERERLCKGDINAFEALCLMLEQPLFAYLLRLVRDRSEAEDLAQEALLRLFRMAREGRLRGEPRPLVFSIAHNLAVDFHRRANKVVAFNPSRPPPASRKAERALCREAIDKALARLPETHRSALMLREFGELNYAEIAETLGVSAGVVKTWIYRARRRMAQLLDRDGQYVGERSHGV